MKDTRPPLAAGSVATRILRSEGERIHYGDDFLAVEEPLEIGLSHANGKTASLGVLLRTPGDDKALLTGLLFNEGVISGAADIGEIKVRTETSATVPAARAIAALRSHLPFDPERLHRNFPISSACGACGKSALEALKILRDGPLPLETAALSRRILGALPGRLASEQSLFSKTGGAHACARFTQEGRLIDLREDVGRHNALDKLIGAALLSANTDWSRDILLLSGRAGYDLLQKAIMVGCPIIASIGAPSSLAVELASLYRITLIGFLKDGRFNLYSHPERIILDK